MTDKHNTKYNTLISEQPYIHARWPIFKFPGQNEPHTGHRVSIPGRPWPFWDGWQAYQYGCISLAWVYKFCDFWPVMCKCEYRYIFKVALLWIMCKSLCSATIQLTTAVWSLTLSPNSGPTHQYADASGASFKSNLKHYPLHILILLHVIYFQDEMNGNKRFWCLVADIARNVSMHNCVYSGILHV